MIKAICIDNKNKPAEIPEHKWLKLKKEYTVTHVYKQIRQGGMLAVGIAEINLDTIPDCPYNCFRIDRFAFDANDLEKLSELVILCGELNDIDIDELIKQEVITTE